jgi:hypothetical protein
VRLIGDLAAVILDTRAVVVDGRITIYLGARSNMRELRILQEGNEVCRTAGTNKEKKIKKVLVLPAAGFGL